MKRLQELLFATGSETSMKTMEENTRALQNSGTKSIFKCVNWTNARAEPVPRSVHLQRGDRSWRSWLLARAIPYTLLPILTGWWLWSWQVFLKLGLRRWLYFYSVWGGSRWPNLCRSSQVLGNLVKQRTPPTLLPRPLPILRLYLRLLLQRFGYH